MDASEGGTSRFMSSTQISGGARGQFKTGLSQADIDFFRSRELAEDKLESLILNAKMNKSPDIERKMQSKLRNIQD